MDLIAELPPGVPFRLYADRFFGSLKLVDRLSTMGYGYTGTIMTNRTEHCPVEYETKKSKAQRGDIDYRLDTVSNSLVVTWNDNRMVTMVTNIDTVHPIEPAQRWIAAKKQRIGIARPNTVKQYNTYMGGVDRMDQNIDNYRVGIRSKKWWWPVFMFCIDTSCHNAWQLCRKLPNSEYSSLDYLGFRPEVVRAYLAKYGVDPQVAGRPCTHKKLDSRIPVGVRYDGIGHWLQSAEKQNRCAHCSKNTTKMCIKCHVNLHSECFRLFHTE